MSVSMRMFVLGVVVGAAVTAAAAFWASAEASNQPQAGVEWSATADGATVRVTEKNQVVFVAARLRDGVSPNDVGSLVLEAGKVYVPNQHYDRAMVFGAVGLADIDWSRADPSRTCAPCILPPPPPPGHYAFVALTRDHAASFPQAAEHVP